MGKVYLFLLTLIIVLAFGLRFYKITEIPPALNWDEVSIGYNSYSILKTAHDEWSQFLPVHFKAYGEYKLPLQIYASIPGIAIFGLNELGVRITPVIYGTLTVLFVFLLAKEFFKKKEIGLLAAFLLTISPWHLQLTRGSFESAFALMWVTLGMWFLVKGFENKKWLVWSMIPFAASMYTYNSSRVFTPLFLAFILFFYRKFFLKIKGVVLAAVILFSFLMLPLAPFYLSGEGNARYKLVSITDDPGLVPRVNENRGKSTLPEPLPELVHNKYTYVAFYIIQNYLAHFSPDFLFISGAPHKQHHVQGIGELYLFQAPFLLLGLYLLFKRKIRYKGVLLSWLLLAFVPVSVTNDSIPHALRTLNAVPVYQLISGLGIYSSFIWLKQRFTKPWLIIFVISLISVVTASVYLYFVNYYTIYPVLYSRDWQYGYKQVVEYIQANQNKYDEIVFSRYYGEPHMFTLFFLQYDPWKYQTNPNLIRFETNNWVWVLRFDKYYFPDLGDPGTHYEDLIKNAGNKKLLFIGKPGDFPNSLPRLKTIDFLNGQRAFEIVEYP